MPVRKGFIHSIETRRKISVANRGKPSWSKGKKLSEEHRRKLSISHTGKKHTVETKNKLSLLKSGVKLSEQHKINCVNGRREKSGWKKSLETRKKMVDSARRGKDNHLWKGGITPLNISIRQSSEYKLWRESVFTRDNYTCIWCGARNGNGKTVTLNADHIKPFAYFPELRFAIDNGRTLCVPCHKTTNTYAGKGLKRK